MEADFAHDYILENKIPEKHWWFRARNNLIYIVLKKVSSFIEGGNKDILDVGSGYGQLFSIWQKFGNVYSVENNKHYTDYQKKYYKNVVVWSSEFPDKDSSKYTYDLICMCDFLEHVQDPDKILRQDYELLKNKGFLLITVPAYKWLWSYFDVRSGHVKRYLRKELISNVEEIGFKCIYSTYFMTFLFIPAVIIRKFINSIKKKNNEFPGLEFASNGRFLNKLLYYIFNLETLFIRRKIVMPFGLSILGVFQRSSD
ncbi:MAG TPA: class I SAM-dependent methyltransferase [Candidatus Humimicrobiaceae bacterium]